MKDDLSLPPAPGGHASGTHQSLSGLWTWPAAAQFPGTPVVTAPPAPALVMTMAEIVAAEDRLRAQVAGKAPEAALNLLRGMKLKAPADIVVMRFLADINVGLKRYPQAEARLAEALELAPHYAGARDDLAGLLMAQRKPSLALPHLERLVADHPDDESYRMRLAWCLGNVGDYDRSIALYEACTDALLEQPTRLLHYAMILKYAGHRAESIQVCRVCQEMAPHLGETWWTLAELKTERFSEADMASMRALLDDTSVAAPDRIHIHYAMGLALEQARDYAGSFSQYAKGAALKHATAEDNTAHSPEVLRLSKAFFTPAFFAQRTGAGCPDPAPIFILGMPRAGSTLIEQILASHSLVEGTQELPEIPSLATDIVTQAAAQGALGFPDCLAALDRAALARLGERYIERTRIYRRTASPFFIDKSPINWINVGLIHMILPNAKIIDVRRHPMANGFSVFKHLFGGGAHYSYDLREIGNFYRRYVDLMAHFDAVLPGRIHRVIYEDVVADSETEIRRLLAHCGLNFEPACLRFWDSKRAVATPSSEQVRQPIFRDGLEQWRNYAPWLGELQAALAAPGALPWNGQHPTPL